MANKFIENFLIKNDFTKISDVCFKNDKCKIYIYDYYIVEMDGGEIISDNLVIYWLIGLLTYHNLINKNYKI